MEDKEKELTAIQEKRINFEKNLNNVWGYSTLGIEAKRAAMSMLATKTGMYSRIPIICKGSTCPYANTCSLLACDLTPIGEPCPIETTNIENKTMAYANDFNLDENSYTDRVLTSEIVNLDIMIDRCKALLSKETNPIIDVVSGISETGETFSRPEISKAFDLYERCLKKKEDLLNDMSALRKNKKDSDGDKDKNVFDVIQEALKNGIEIEERPDNIVDVELDDERRL